jgi:hypothetical protein
MIHQASMLDLVSLTDQITSTTKIGALGDAFSFAEGISCNFKFSSFLDTVAFADRIDLASGRLINVNWSDVISWLEETHPRSHIESLSDVFYMIDWFVIPNIYQLNDTLVFTDTFSVIAATALSDQLVFTDTLTLNGNLSKVFSDTLTLNDAFTGFVNLPWKPLYPVVDPFMDGWAGCDPSNITMTDPDGVTIGLPMPKFGNNETINFKRVNKTSRGNDIIIRSIPGWQSEFLQRFEWDYLSEAQKDRLKLFVSKNVGRPVDVAGIYGEVWKVIFLRPDTEFSQVGRENRTVTIDMQKVE